MKNVTIVLTTYNRANFLKKCLSSLLSNTDHSKFELIIWNNNSNDETKEIIESYERKDSRIRGIHSPVNYMLNGYGLALKRIQPKDYIVDLDDDVIEFPKGWLGQMLYAFERVPYLGFLAANVVQDGKTNGSKLDSKNYIEKDYGNGVVIEFGPTGGWCTMTPRHLYEKVGGFLARKEKVFELEDADYRKKIAHEGYLFGILKGTKVYHASGEICNREAGYDQVYSSKYISNKKLKNLYYEPLDAQLNHNFLSINKLKNVLFEACRSYEESLTLYFEMADYIRALISNGLTEEPSLFLNNLVGSGQYRAKIVLSFIELFPRVGFDNPHGFSVIYEQSVRLKNCLEKFTQHRVFDNLQLVKELIEKELFDSVNSLKKSIRHYILSRT